MKQETSGWHLVSSTLQSSNGNEQRICTLLPSATEIAYSLGLGLNVVGVTHECDYPSDVQHKRRVVRTRIDENATSAQVDTQVRSLLEQGQPVYELDADAVDELAPQLIITQGLCEVCALPYDHVTAVAETMDTVPTIVSLNPTCLGDVFDDIIRVGRAAGVQNVAIRVVNELRERVNALRAKVARLPIRKVACLEWLDPLMIGGHWVPEMVQMAGGQDVLGTPSEPTRRVTAAEVINGEPDVILLMPCGFSVAETVTEASSIGIAHMFTDTPAHGTRQIYAVNANAYFSRSGPRLVDGLELLADLVHPELRSNYTDNQAVNLLDALGD